MSLLGTAALLLVFDIEAEARAEHDRWHTHEHLPERLALPGFLRGSRWVATEGGPRYLVLYEVATLDVLSSPAYLARLDAPTPWTARMMPHYRGMRRGLCAVRGSFGLGLGGSAALLRFAVAPQAAAALQQWLLHEALPALPTQAGLGSAHLLQGAGTATMTREQRIRGADGGIDGAIVLTGYDAAAVAAAATRLAAAEGLPAHGALQVEQARYSAGFTLVAAEIAP